MLNFGNKEFRNLQEQVLENAKNIEMLKERPGLKPVVVAELPATGEENILYLVPKNPDPDTSDADSYDEYIWLPETQTFEFVGSTAIDLQYLSSPIYVTIGNKPEGLSYGLRIQNNGWTSEIQQEGGAKIELNGTAVKVNNPIELGSGMSIKNHDQASSNYIDLIQDNSQRMAIGSSNYSYVDFLPGANGTINLGSDIMRWKDLYLAGQINFSTGPSIKQDSSNRIIITGANGAERIKIGGETSTYCAANWTPDQDNKYLLGTATSRWSVVNTASVKNEYSSLTLKGKNNITCDGYVVPATNHQYTVGNSNAIWLNVFTDNITDGTNSVAVADIVTKPDYDNPTAYASGTLDANGQSTIDMIQTGVPSDGLYMFTYGNCQCFLSITSTMIQNAASYPIRCPCPTMYSGSAYPGILKIERTADVLTLTVATAGVGVVQPSGYQWQLIKVM